jgi:hypothetical protein
MIVVIAKTSAVSLADVVSDIVAATSQVASYKTG